MVVSEGLFELAPVELQPAVGGTAAVGAAAEFEAISLLLRRGHKVAVPVVDDDGVDLIVDYRVTVQVKSTAMRSSRGLPILGAARHVRRHRGEASTWRVIGSHVDVVLVSVRDVGWYVIPRDVIGARRNVSLGPSMDPWREAWDVFDAAE